MNRTRVCGILTGEFSRQGSLQLIGIRRSSYLTVAGFGVNLDVARALQHQIRLRISCVLVLQYYVMTKNVVLSVSMA